MAESMGPAYKGNTTRERNQENRKEKEGHHTSRGAHNLMDSKEVDGGGKIILRERIVI